MFNELRCYSILLLCLTLFVGNSFSQKSFALTKVILGNFKFPDSQIVSVSDENEKPMFQFGVVSDIHVQQWNRRAKLKFLGMLRDIKEHLNAHTLIINGDLGNGTPQDYSTLRKLVAAQAKPLKIYYTIGNHEFYQAYENPKTERWSPKTFPNGETEQAAIQRFLSLTGHTKVYYDEYLSGYHFIFLGSEKSAMSEKKYGDKAYLSNIQLVWLEQKLKENYVSHKPIFVFLHQPFPNSISGSWYRTVQSAIVQENELRTILGRYPEVIFISGHTHGELGLNHDVYQGLFTMVNDSSVEMPISKKGKNKPYDSEGLWIKVYKNKVVIQGRNFAANAWIPKAIYNKNL